MKISKFKLQFSQLSTKDQEITISKMIKGGKHEHNYSHLPKNEQNDIKEEFNQLIIWCKENKNI